MEMRGRIKNIISSWLRICFLVLCMLSITVVSDAQDTMKIYTVKNGKMYIWLSKKLPSAELEEFISQFDLGHLALKRFINTGMDDSIKLAGWQVDLNNSSSFTLTKPLYAFDEINNPADRILFTGQPPSISARFPSVSNAVMFGFNRFRNKHPFAIRDSVVTFYLKGYEQAKRVSLAGSFNNWDPDILSMIKTDSGWIADVKLRPGKYWYKFIADGRWMVDEDNRLSENDGEGNINSVFYYTNTHFRLPGYSNAKKVFLTGSFNNWKGEELAMEKSGDEWKLTMYLANGTHTYKFVVDKNWIADPGNPNRLPNEFNDYNSYIAIGKPYVFKLDGYTGAQKIVLSGSFNRWRIDELYMTKTATGWELPYVLGPGNYEYKFIVDGKSISDPANPPHADNGNKNNSYLILNPNYTFRLKGFENARTVYLTGEFNNWTPNSLAMKKENGEWVFTVHLSPGKHLYKFIVDGNWIRDPGNQLWEENGGPNGNSVLWIE